MEILKQYRKTLRFLRPYLSSFLVLFFIGLLSTSVALTQPYLTKLVIDQALGRHDMSGLWALAGLMALFGAVSFVLGIISTRWYTRLSASVLFDMRLKAFQRLQSVSPQYFLQTKTGDIVSRLNGDIAELQRLSADTLLAFPTNVLFLAGSSAMMIYLNWRLSIVSLALTPIAVWAMRRYQGTLRNQVQDLRQQSSAIGSFIIESILSMRVIVGMNAQHRKEEEFQQRNTTFVSSLLRLQTTSFLAGALPGAVITLSTAALFLLGGSMVIRGIFTIGGLMAFMAYYSRVLSPVQGFMSSYSALVTGSVSLNRVYELLELRVEVSDPVSPKQLLPGEGILSFQKVAFQYENGRGVDCVSFTLRPRSINALVGVSGAGKSTIADLAMRFYDPQSGTITLNGVALPELSLSDIRRTIAVVEQSPFLFHSSLRDNLILAEPGALESHLYNAIDAAGILSFVKSLPEQLDTVVGERGLALSAGQRQRVAIARALLRNPEILILDEPSSALDAVAELALANTLRKLSATCTIVVITHRAALSDVADYVLTLEDGRIVEQVVSGV